MQLGGHVECKWVVCTVNQTDWSSDVQFPTIAPHLRPAPGSALAAVVGQALARWKSTAAPDRSFGAQCQERSDSNGRSVHDLGTHRVVQVYFGLLCFDRDDQAVSNLIVESLLRYQGLPPSRGGVDTEYAQACQV